MKTNSNQDDQFNQSKVSVLCDSIVERSRVTTGELTQPKHGLSKIGLQFDQSPLKFLTQTKGVKANPVSKIDVSNRSEYS